MTAAGPRIHALSDLPFGPRTPEPHQRVPIAYAITLTWDRPKGDGQWLVVERTYDPGSPFGRLERISDGGVVRARADTHARAETLASRLASALARGLNWTRYEVVAASAVTMLDSDQPLRLHHEDAVTAAGIIELAAVREHIRLRGAGMWSGRTTDERDHDEDDTHLTAWAWIDRPRDVALAGAEVQVRHPEYTDGEWCTVAESIR